MKPTQNIECKLKFDIPSGYFDNLADQVLERAKYEDTRQKHRSSVLRAVWCVAASVMIVAGSAMMAIHSSQSESMELSHDYYTDIHNTFLESMCDDITVIECLTETQQKETSINEESVIDLVSDYPTPAYFPYN